MRKISFVILICSFTCSFSQHQVFDRSKLLLESFDYNQVKLYDSPMKRQFDEVESFYLAIPNDDLLKGFRKRAGLPTYDAKDMGGWYTSDIFHVFGQLLAGYSRFYAVTGNEALKTKVNTLIEEWGKCIDSTGFFYYTNKPYAPHYVYEKMVGGLVDAYVFTGNKSAITYLSIITDWAINNLDREGIEWYTLSENLYRAYQITKDKKYLHFGKAWEYPDYWDTFALGGNIFNKQPYQLNNDFDYHAYSHLNTLHAYSHLNTLSGAAAAYLISGDEKYKTTILNAYDFFQEEQCFATGGFGPDESLLPKDGLINALRESHASFETQCGSWAIFKLSKYLLEITGDAKYGDWIEKMIINGIGLNIPMTEDGRVLYYSDYNAREGAKVYHDSLGLYIPGFWSCCTGTRPQAIAEYANLVYFKGREGLYVNLYTPSRVVWDSISITQSTKFPESNETVFVIGLKGSEEKNTTIHFRKPLWVNEEPVVFVNNKKIKPTVVNNWMQINRQWKDGDKVKIIFPMSLYVDRLDESKEYPAAIMYGPVAMAVNVVNEYPADIVLPFISSNFIPIDKPLTYKVQNHPELILRPFYQFELYEPYTMYFDPAVKNRIPDQNLIFAGHWWRRGWGFFRWKIRSSSDEGASVTTSFTGEGIKVFFIKHRDSGKALIAIDGNQVDKVDLYSHERDFLIKEYKVKASTKHIIKISVSGEKNINASNTNINIRYLEILE